MHTHTHTQLRITEGELNSGVGGSIAKEFDIARKIQILYLDETLRIARWASLHERSPARACACMGWRAGKAGL
jgi:hypothetical protein